MPQYLQSKTSRVEKLRRVAARAAAFNPEDADVATGVTMTVNAATDASLTRIITGANIAPYCRLAGGRPVAGGAGNAYLYFPVASVYPATNGNLSAALTSTPDFQSWGWSAEIETDADVVQFEVNSATSLYTRVQVDGRYVSKTPSAGINFVAYIKLDFGGVRKPRRIKLEGAGNDTLRRIAVGPTANFGKPARSADRVLAFVTGDSYGEGQGATSANMGWAQVLGRLMGWSDVRQVAVGGTGYLNNGGGLGRSIIRDQIPRWFTVNSDLTPADVDIVPVAGGFNDVTNMIGGTVTAAQVQAEALADFALIRQACPNALIPVIGPWAGRRGPDAQTLSCEAAIQAAVTAFNDPLCTFLSCSTNAAPWLFGTGRVGATTGDGNADVAITADGTHPTDLGHAIIAARAAAGIRSMLAAY